MSGQTDSVLGAWLIFIKVFLYVILLTIIYLKTQNTLLFHFSFNISLSPLRKCYRKFGSSWSPAKQENKTSTQHDGNMKKEFLHIVSSDTRIYKTPIL